MKKTFLSLALISACGTATAAELYNGRLSGMSGAGYVTGGYSDGVLLNPSLAASHSKEDKFAFVLNLGALGADEDDLIDNMDDLVDHIDYLQTVSADALTEADAEKLMDGLERIDEKNIQATFGGSLVIAVPNDVVSVAIVSKAYGSANVYADVDEDDYSAIDTAVENQQEFDPDTLESSGYAQGVLVTEIGIALATTIAETETSRILVGITPKRVSVETFDYEATVSEYDEDDFDGDDYTKEGDTTSMDAGVTFISGKLRYGLSMTNVMSKDFKTIYGETYELSRQTTAAVGYTGDWFTAEAALDLTAAEVFGFGGESKMFRAGVELRPVSWFQIRGGLQRDTEDTLPDTYSIGLGVSPFNVFNIDLAAFTGKDETTGGALQIGLRF